MVHKLVNFIFFLRTFASEIKKKVNEECLQDRIKKSLIDKEIIYIEKQGGLPIVSSNSGLRRK